MIKQVAAMCVVAAGTIAVGSAAGAEGYDLDSDGVADVNFDGADRNGDGVTDTFAYDLNFDNVAELYGYDVDQNGYQESYFVAATGVYWGDYDGDGVLVPVDANGNPLLSAPTGPGTGTFIVGGPNANSNPDWLTNLVTWGIENGGSPAFGPTDTDGDGYHDGIDRDIYDPYYA